jgi:hypothetical protein
LLEVIVGVLQIEQEERHPAVVEECVDDEPTC